ncbi:MAG TPA: hypothetical protein PK659_09360 [Methanothrix sp.]|nr:hypothetical protein [Methanothrix sp.]HOL44446.1 hypothetical protein [Methanothrix sp.]
MRLRKILMQRIHAPFDEPTIERIDAEVKKKGISRAQWLSSVVSSYLRLSELTKYADPEEMIQEVTQLRTANENLWRENQSLKRSEESARTELDQARRKLSALEEQIASVTQDLETTRSELLLSKRDIEHLQETIRLKDEEIAFLKSHISQLTQSISQLSLKPGEEEIKQKKWWKLWR